jgi:hypothetical protein
MQNANGSISTDQYVQFNYDSMSALINNLPFYITALLSILLAIQLTVRFALICLQAVLSPLVFACGALPGDMGQMVLRPWIRGFGSLLVVQLLQVMVILAGTILFSSLTTIGSTTSEWVGTLFTTLMPIIIIVVALNVPRMMGSATTNIISMVSSSFSSASTGILLIIRGI